MTSTGDPMEEVRDDREENRDEAQENHETQQNEESQTQEHDEAQTEEQDASENDTTSGSVKRPSDVVETADAPAPAQSEEQSQPQEEETDAPPAKRRALCGVCDTEAAKYKCSRCRLGYCSLACSRKHQENHPPDEPKAQVKLDVQQPEKEKTPQKPVHPFQVLDDAPELQRLFKEYPRLPARLRSIHDATLPPRGGNLTRGRGGRGRGNARGGFANKTAQPWTKEIGLLQGQKALRRARVDPTEDGDAVRAYCEVVTYLLGKGAAEAAASANATAIVRAELEAEGAQVIQQLLDAEGRQ